MAETRRRHRTPEERVAYYESKLKAAKAEASKAERARRTRRLIQIGAVVEKALNAEFSEEYQREALGMALADLKPQVAQAYRHHEPQARADISQRKTEQQTHKARNVENGPQNAEQEQRGTDSRMERIRPAERLLRAPREAEGWRQ